MFALAHLRRLGLSRIHLRDLRLELLDRLLQLCRRRGRLVDARRRLVELARQVRLLRLRLRRLLVAEGLLRRLLGGLLLERSDHILDEPTDFAERVRASASRELHETEAVELLLEALENADRARARLLLGDLAVLRAHARRRLQEHLHAVGEDLLRLLNSSGLLRRLLLARVPLLGLGAAALLELSQVLLVR